MTRSHFLHGANVVARALIPVLGIVFLGWSGGKVLLVYLADTLASMYAISALAAYAAMQSEPEFQAWAKGGLTLGKRLRIGISVALMGFVAPVMVAIPFGGILAIFLTIQDFWWTEALYDRQLWFGMGCQFLGALALLLPQLGWIKSVKDPGKLVRARTGFLCARWFALIFVGMILVDLPRQIYFVLLVLVYAAGTIVLELAPEEVLMALNAKDLLDATTGHDAGSALEAEAPPSRDAVPKSVLRHFRNQDRP